MEEYLAIKKEILVVHAFTDYLEGKVNGYLEGTIFTNYKEENGTLGVKKR